MIEQFPLFLRRLGCIAFFGGVFLATSARAQVPAPTFSPVAGVYSSAQTVTISTATTALPIVVSIIYTIDGSTPAVNGNTVLNGNVYSAPLAIGATTTLNAITVETNINTLSTATSSVATAVYIINVPQVAAPTFSPTAGTYGSAQSVTISTATTGASIVYTTDGSTPSQSHGTTYTGPVSVNGTTSFQAMAFKSGSNDSTLTNAVYTINITQPNQVAAPAFSVAPGTYTSTQSVTISTATTGASIVYTTDGSTPAETGGAVTHGTLYSGPVSVGASGAVTLNALAFKSGMTDSFVSSSAYAFQVLPPTFSPAAGTYASAQSVTITSATSGASIRYTTDGSIPSQSNGLFYGSFGPPSISSATTLKAIAYKTGFTDSPVISGRYAITSSSSASLNVLYNFTPSNNVGTEPTTNLVQGSDGNFYGTASSGGDNRQGTVFKMTTAGVATVLVSFNFANGAEPSALMQGSDGNFYGTTETGGIGNDGTVFKLTPAGVLTTLASFNCYNGDDPNGLVQGSDGNFYGTTINGGSVDDDGIVYKMTPSGTLTTLVTFNGPNGANSFAALVQGNDGNFYGTTEGGGSGNDGTVFQMTPAGVLTTLVSFNGTNGAFPVAALIQGRDGNFYGTTFGDATNNYGTVFRMTPAGVLTTLASFDGTNGAFPTAALVQASDGNFYGTTVFGGTTGNVFKMTPAGVLTNLAFFAASGNIGSEPLAPLIQASDGNLYGTTQAGGTSNEGVIFQLLLPTVAAPTFSPAAGTYASAQSVTITSTTTGATIRYTTDGSTPTETTGTLYAGPVSISSSLTLKAVAYEAGFTDSPVTSGAYTITLPAASASPASGGGGGGAPSWWFLGALAFAGILRWKLGQKMPGESQKS